VLGLGLLSQPRGTREGKKGWVHLVDKNNSEQRMRGNYGDSFSTGKKGYYSSGKGLMGSLKEWRKKIGNRDLFI